jgi:hypothetical protein
MRGKAAKDQRRADADVRQAKYNNLTTQQKLDQLPADGANKQRAKLLARLEAEKAPKAPAKAKSTK